VADVPTEVNWMMTKARRLGEGGFDAMWARPWRWLHAFVEVAAWAGGYHIVASSQSIGQRCSARVKAPSNSSRSSSSERARFMSGYPPSPSFRTTSSSLKTSPGRSQGVCHAGARVNALSAGFHLFATEIDLGLSRGCSRKRFKASKDGVATVDPRTANDARRLHAMSIPTGDARQNMLLTNRSFRSWVLHAHARPPRVVSWAIRSRSPLETTGSPRTSASRNPGDSR
jgi:hypothetical protein